MLKVNLRGVKGIISSYTVDTKSENPTTIKVPHQGALNIELIDSATGHAPQMVVTGALAIICSFSLARMILSILILCWKIIMIMKTFI